MRNWGLMLVLAVVLSAPVDAHVRDPAHTPWRGTTLVTPGGAVAQPYQQWAWRSKVPTAPGVVKVIPATDVCGASAWACAEPNTIWVMRPIGRFLLLHELGHLFDFHYLTNADRAYITRLIAPGQPWLVNESGDIDAGENFANVYADCAIYSGRLRRVGMLIWKPICKLIQRVAHRTSAPPGSGTPHRPADS